VLRRGHTICPRYSNTQEVPLAEKKNRRKRPWGAEATRAALVAAARSKFATERYEDIGLREIARDANVDLALIGRYFGSKKGLFVQVIRELTSPAMLISGPRETFGRRMAQAAMKGEPGPTLQAIFVIMRAAASPAAQPIMEDICYASFTRPFAKWIGGKNSELRAQFIALTLFGASLSVAAEKRIRHSRAMRTAFARELEHRLQALVDGR
jgi:AcrR family transcriptional regulator